MKKIITAIILLLSFITYHYYQNMDISHTKEYKKDYEKFVELHFKVTKIPTLDNDFYLNEEYIYNLRKKYKFPTDKREYLKDKLAYYKEVRYQNKPYYDKLIDYVSIKLALTKANEQIKPNRFFMKNLNNYFKKSEKLLPLYDEVAEFLAIKFIKEKNYPANRKYHNELKEIIKTLEKIDSIQNSSEETDLFYVLNGGEGKKVPLDDFEKKIFEKYEHD